MLILNILLQYINVDVTRDTVALLKTWSYRNADTQRHRINADIAQRHSREVYTAQRNTVPIPIHGAIPYGDVIVRREIRANADTQGYRTDADTR